MGVERRFKALAKQPEAGQARPDLAPELRFLPVGNYLIFYRPIENGVLSNCERAGRSGTA
jgi:toxin ParE1/3/4